MLKILCLVLFTSSTFYAQNSSIDWLNKNVIALKSDSSNDFSDLKFLSKVLKDKHIVGLGEASHGTHEFYLQKSRIIEYLIKEENYKTLALEATSASIESLNKFILNGDGDIKTMLKSMGLYNSKEMYDLCVWIMNYNKTKTNNDKFRLVGIDHEDYWADPYTRDKLMAENFIAQNSISHRKTIIWSHNLHIAKDTTMAEFKALGYYINQEFGNKFYAIGFDTYKGNVNVLDNEGQLEKHDFEGSEGTFSSLFAKVKYQLFFIDFTIANNPLKNEVNKITNLYSNWKTPTPLPVKLGSDFDGLIFIRKTTASIGLE
ncbi:erythromycin esterase family protein [Flavobacterium hercynium]|uniref:Erythromycin esterase n=1 Tax=Flavobacterium hercynium TaxID=387094 RepID=A0A226HJE2_9FLAO|nr:erythromycin esterase family protein [Flavobacterium hercynium]OXA93751.1 hypothetical protein B0A66_05705 [Flavobacterium hercynium]SMP20672.1 Erythromycin esterase [Flavobacterium hercynium]